MRTSFNRCAHIFLGLLKKKLEKGQKRVVAGMIFLRAAKGAT